MGATCASGLTAFSPGTNGQPVKVLIIGKQATGKTYLLYSWKYGVDSILSVEPTSHFNVDTITTQSGMTILVYDLAGDIGLRMRPFMEGTNAVVYMLGLHSEDNFLQDGDLAAIQQLLQERDLENVPFLFVLRKDVEIKECHEDLFHRLQENLKERVWDLVQIRSRSQEDANLVLKNLENLINKTARLKS